MQQPVGGCAHADPPTGSLGAGSENDHRGPVGVRLGDEALRLGTVLHGHRHGGQIGTDLRRRSLGLAHRLPRALLRPRSELQVAADGARPVVGGGPVEGPGFFVAPTVLADVAAGSEASQEEIFGPVVTIETFESEDEAITRANEVPYGLAAEVPWGGFKGSGYGRDLSIYALGDFSRTKHVQINHAR